MRYPIQIVSVIAFGLSASLTFAGGPSDYVACWTFDERTGTVLHDSSANGFHGNVSGAVWAPGMMGNSLQFNGVDDFVEISDGDGYPDLIGSLSVGTVSLWLKFDSIPVDRTIHPLFYLGDGIGGPGNSSLIIEVGHFTTDNTKVYFTILTDDRYIPLCFDSGVNLALHTWYHFAAVVATNFNTGYLNGQEMTNRHYNFGNASLSYFFDDIVDKRVCWLGRGFLGSDTPTHYLNGQIDDIRIYNRPLTATEISSYYQSVINAIAPDWDRDGDVDGEDLMTFTSCFSGPAVPHDGSPTCDRTDFDNDNDVDLSDFGILQRCYSGESIPADPDCAN